MDRFLAPIAAGIVCGLLVAFGALLAVRRSRDVPRTRTALLAIGLCAAAVLGAVALSPLLPGYSPAQRSSFTTPGTPGPFGVSGATAPPGRATSSPAAASPTLAPKPSSPAAASPTLAPSPSSPAAAPPTVAPAPSTPAPAAPSPSPAATGRVHVVRAGEWLILIAQRYGTTVEALAELNGVENPDALEVGQVLRVPAG